MGVRTKRRSGPWSAKDSLEELAELARSAGAQVVGSVSQRIEKPTHYYLGKGKIEELKELVEERRAHTVVCDDELTPTQQRNLEDALDGAKVIDRTALILDVFGRRARSREGRLQVELAQHEYLMPRLAGQWSHLERLGGGIGTRGPGETQIETDRRLVSARISRLKRSLEDVRRHRGQYRAKRRDERMPVASLVGYTNAGKSTLMNRLTKADVFAENKMFSTLDPVTRKIVLPGGRELLLTDTVGFIQKLPATVVTAFRATLEEVEESSLILHVVDITHRNAAEQAHVVDEILTEMGLSKTPTVLVFNKIDLLEPDGGAPSTTAIEDAVGRRSRVVFTSATTGEGLPELKQELGDLLTEIEGAPVAVHA